MPPDPIHSLPVPDWQPVAEVPALPEDQIHLWRIRLEPPPEESPNLCLNSEERERGRRQQNSNTRRRFELTHTAKRVLLGAYLGKSATGLKFEIPAGGKPRLADGAGLEFNLSHSGELALLAVGKGRSLGVDLERMKPVENALRIARRVFPGHLIERLETIAPEHRDHAFLLAWTEFEARQKLTGAGIFGSEASWNPSDTFGFSPTDGYIATLAWARSDSATQICHYDFNGLRRER